MSVDGYLFLIIVYWLLISILSLEPECSTQLIFIVNYFQSEYFQDDIFPDTRVLWEPCLTSAEWFSGLDTQPKLVSLRPDDMKPRKPLR